jgi:hypothetical protein
MNDDGRSASDQERERDEILKRLLKSPPQPRPQRERDKNDKPKRQPKKKV